MRGVPRIVTHDYIELARITRFRSGFGHDYSDVVERCGADARHAGAAMTDALFQTYAARGIVSRSVIILSATERAADPLSCVGEAFQGPGNLPNWIQLQ